MTTLSEIIRKTFDQDVQQAVIEDLIYIKFHSKIDKAIGLINKCLWQLHDDESSQVKFEHILVSLYLNGLQFHRISSKRIKQIFESYLLPVLRSLYIETILSIPANKRIQFLMNIEILIKDFALVFNLRYIYYGSIYRLNNFFILHELEKINNNDRIYSSSYYQRIPGFVWNSQSESSFNNFLKIIDELDICDPKRFIKLFDNPKQKLDIKLNPSDPDFILQFLCCLKESKLISYYNTRGFYQVLRTHIKDFDTIFLKNRKPQRRVDTVKNLVTWPINRNRIDKSFRRLL